MASNHCTLSLNEYVLQVNEIVAARKEALVIVSNLKVIVLFPDEDKFILMYNPPNNTEITHFAC